jgi:hypothetical protein
LAGSSRRYSSIYVIRNWGAGPREVAERLRPLLGDPEAEAAIDVLRRDFGEVDGVGPRRVAAFLTGGVDEGVQGEVVAFVGELLEVVGRGGRG